MASRGSRAESLKLQSEPSNFPSRNGGRLAARRDHECMGPSTGPGVVWEGCPPRQPRKHSKPQQGPRAPGALHVDMTGPSRVVGVPGLIRGKHMCGGSGLVQGWRGGPGSI